MPKPKSKTELLEASQTNYQRLLTLISNYSTQELERTFPKGTLNRNIRDVIGHLHHWHLLMLGWYEVGMSGEKPDMPAKGYTWKTMPALNKMIWEIYRDTELELVLKKLDDSYARIQKLIHQHSDEELFEKKKYPWTGSTSLGVYFISNTSSHYHWAYQLIKKANR